MKVEVIVNFKEGHGFKKIMEVDETTTMEFQIEVPCYAEAQRMVRCLLPIENRDHINDIIITCLD